MLSRLCRQVHSTENIPEFISKLKELFKKSEIKDIVDSYKNLKIAEQKTIHLKMLQHRIGTRLHLQRDLFETAEFKEIFYDLLKDFESFSLSEMNDFLTFYRRLLQIGTPNMLSDERFLKLKEVLSNVRFELSHYSSIRSPTIYNCALLDIENKYLSVAEQSAIHYMRSSDIHQIFKSMIINKNYYNEQLVKIIEKNVNLLHGKTTGIENSLKVLDLYLLIAEKYNFRPAPEVIRSFEKRCESFIELNELLIYKLFSLYSSPRMKSFLDQYKNRFKAASILAFNNNKYLFTFVKELSIIFKDDRDYINLAYSELKEKVFSNKQTQNSSEKLKILYPILMCQYNDIKFLYPHIEHFLYARNKPFIAMELLVLSNVIRSSIDSNFPEIKLIPSLKTILDETQIDKIFLWKYKFQLLSKSIKPSASLDFFFKETELSINEKKLKCPHVKLFFDKIEQFSEERYYVKENK